VTVLNVARAQSAGRLLELIVMRLMSEALHVAAALGLADLLAGSPQSAEQLADATGANAQSLRRVLRALVSFGVFAQDSADRFVLAPMGELLRSDVEGSLRTTALFFGGEWGARVDALFLPAVQRGESAGQMLSGGRTWIDWLQSDPELNKIFNSMMTAFSALHFAGVLEAYDFSECTRLVDVGGGHGWIIAQILRRYPRLRGVLFDLPHTFEGGRRTIEQAGLVNRCEVASGDFFVSVPNGADLYLLSRVIHDWNDDKAVAILKVVRAALAPHGRLILLETMLQPSVPPIYPVLSDLNMLVRTGGCERTEAEYRSLYRAAGFELSRAIATAAPTGTTIIEGRPLF
jgi:SAM-dependent methyltransferase